MGLFGYCHPESSASFRGFEGWGLVGDQAVCFRLEEGVQEQEACQPQVLHSLTGPSGSRRCGIRTAGSPAAHSQVLTTPSLQI